MARKMTSNFFELRALAIISDLTAEATEESYYYKKWKYFEMLLKMAQNAKIDKESNVCLLAQIVTSKFLEVAPNVVLAF